MCKNLVSELEKNASREEYRALFGRVAVLFAQRETD